MVSEQIYSIFHEVQQGLNFTENVTELAKIAENKKNLKAFLETVDRIFLIIYKNFEPGLEAFTQIKEFIKILVEKIVNIKKSEIPITIINHYCQFFCQEPRKKTLKNISMHFLGLFLNPLSKHPNYYKPESLDEIKECILSALRSKANNYQDAALKFLKKFPTIQNDNDVKERLDEMLLTAPVQIKKSVLGLIDISTGNKLDSLLEMCDDESSEVRAFVFEKLYKLDTLSYVDKKMKVKLFFIGLSEADNKNKGLAKNLLRKLMKEIGILGRSNKNQNNIGNLAQSGVKDSSHMDIDESNNNDIDKDNNDENSREYINNGLTVEEKIANMTSPKKQPENSNFSIKNCPSQLFNELEVLENYNHPKYSHAFELITEAIIGIIDDESLTNCLHTIVDGLSKFRLSPNVNLIATQINNISNDSEIKVDNKNGANYFNDLLFFQLCAKLAYSNDSKINSNSQNAHKFKIIRDFCEDYLPSLKDLAYNINYFYTKVPNVLVVHQLLIIADLCGNFSNDSNNKYLLEILRAMLIDLKLDEKNINQLRSQINPPVENSSKKRDILSQASESNEEFLGNKLFFDQNGKLDLELVFENCLLPNNRKMIFSMVDLLDNILSLLLRIYGSGSFEFLKSMTTIMSELNESLEPLDDENANAGMINPNATMNVSMFKQKQNELIGRIKEKLAEIKDLENLKQKRKGNKADIEKRIINETKFIVDWDKEIEDLKKEENSTNLRILKIAEFLIKNCKMKYQRMYLLLSFIFFKFSHNRSQ